MILLQFSIDRRSASARCGRMRCDGGRFRVARSLSTTCDPRNPLPPVITIFLSLQNCDSVKLQHSQLLIDSRINTFSRLQPVENVLAFTSPPARLPSITGIWITLSPSLADLMLMRNSVSFHFEFIFILFQASVLKALKL